MTLLLISAVAMLAFANGANDNFKGVATLWGSGSARYGPALAWATGFTLLGSLTAIWFATGLVAKFSGSRLLTADVHTQLPFIAAVALGAGATVLLAVRLGLPVSTTHALTGGLVGAGITAAGFSQVNFALLGSGMVVPLLISPMVALLLTLILFPLVVRVTALGQRGCLCLEESDLTGVSAGASTAVAVLAPPAVRWAKSEECQTAAIAIRLTAGDTLHWLSSAAISFARGLNDTPKIAALLLAGIAAGVTLPFGFVAVAMALGGILGAARVARTMSQKITPMSNREAVTANLVAAGLVTLASFWALPVSTTQVTAGGIFSIGLLRRGEADWQKVREVLFSWVATLPLGAVLAAGWYWVLKG